jgi:Transposase IS4
LENSNYAFKALLISKFNNNTIFKIHYPAFNGSEDVSASFFPAYCQLHLDNLQEISRQMYEEYEVQLSNKSLSSSSDENINQITDFIDDEVDDTYISAQPEELENVEEDEAQDPINETFKEGKGHRVEAIVFVSNKFGRRSSKSFSDSSPMEIFLYLVDPMLKVVLDQTNNRMIQEMDSEHIVIKLLTKGELLIWVSCLIFMTLIQLPNVETYWYPGPLELYVKKVLYTKMSLTRYKEIYRYLRFEDYDVDHDSEDTAWKVRSIFTAFQDTIKSVQPAPAQMLSLDESMGKCESIRNPLRRIEPNKPIKVGFKFFSLVEYESKIIVNLTLDDGHITYKNSSTFSYGATGRHVMDLVSCLPGSGYVIFMDNWYSGIPLAQELLSRKIRMVGTLRKDRGVPIFLHFAGKHPKPTERNPKGSLKYAYNTTNTIFMYALMDNSACYFIDTAYGGLAPDIIFRQVGKDKKRLEVPKAIADYNNFMGGIDASDQIRNGMFGLEMKGRTSKWTVRFFEVLLSFALSNSYAIHRSTNKLPITHSEFTISVFDSLFNNTYDDRWVQHDLRKGKSGANDMEEQHEIKSFRKGTRLDNQSNRSKVLACYHCPKIKNHKKAERRTKEYCSVCLVPLHVRCFVAYHTQLAIDGHRKAPKCHPLVVELDGIVD